MDIKHIKKSKLISIIITFVLLVGLTIGVVNMTGNKAQASCSAGIMNNGLNGIYININAAPYTTLATTTSVAYRRGGCAWFASSRARELTGKNIIIHGPANWLNSKYALYGFTRGSQPRAKSLAIYPNHVFVVEEINGDTATISEGATPISDASSVRFPFRPLQAFTAASAVMFTSVSAAAPRLVPRALPRAVPAITRSMRTAATSTCVLLTALLPASSARSRTTPASMSPTSPTAWVRSSTTASPAGSS